MPENWVAKACDKLGGVQKAAAVAGVRLGTMYVWKRQGYVHLLVPAVRLSRATKISVANFAKQDELSA